MSQRFTYVTCIRDTKIQRLKTNKQTNNDLGSWEILIVWKDCSVSTEIGDVNRKLAETELEN